MQKQAHSSLHVPVCFVRAMLQAEQNGLFESHFPSFLSSKTQDSPNPGENYKILTLTYTSMLRGLDADWRPLFTRNMKMVGGRDARGTDGVQWHVAQTTQRERSASQTLQAGTHTTQGTCKYRLAYRAFFQGNHLFWGHFCTLVQKCLVSTELGRRSILPFDSQAYKQATVSCVSKLYRNVIVIFCSCPKICQGQMKWASDLKTSMTCEWFDMMDLVKSCANLVIASADIHSRHNVDIWSILQKFASRPGAHQCMDPVSVSARHGLRCLPRVPGKCGYILVDVNMELFAPLSLSWEKRKERITDWVSTSSNCSVCVFRFTFVFGMRSGMFTVVTQTSWICTSKSRKSTQSWRRTLSHRKRQSATR